ncbi:hypothetical protein jhhlp_004070 [Lomentospora prolificans]|uniref:WH1 domain-containing protein n=1 Tax=Lomentospora prolificans TaxID=41688 RepID=A0A2N3NAK5_9PEZI|nr:hypothetical protein jhhlp_004070 [Lomentospora prolificans]
MVSILNEDDKATVKRVVPKQSNKIQAVGVARLYVAYPNRSKWTYTGLQGAVVLANDLVGNTYWLKMVDISPANRGVIWDQEIFDTWTYNQDRTFFHSFEIEDCLAGLSFVDEKEAALFLKKMQHREKHASRATKATPFGGNGQPTHKHGFLGLGGIFGGHRHSSAPTPPDSPGATLSASQSHQSRLSSGSTSDVSKMDEFALLNAFDPRWRENFGHDLRSKGLTDDFIKDNQEFIVDFLREEQQNQRHKQNASPPSAVNGHPRPPPPPPAPSDTSTPRAELPASNPTPRRGLPPAPPPARRSGVRTESAARPPSPPSEPPAPPRPRFNAPPPLPDAGKFVNSNSSRPVPAASGPAPPPPPRPPKTALNPPSSAPPLPGGRPVPPPPSRGPVPPPPPPSREPVHSLPPPISAAPPPLPPKLPPTSTRLLPPPQALVRSATAPLCSAGARQHPSFPRGPPAPPPPPMPNRDSGYSSGVPSLPSDPSRAGLLDSIHKAGGVSGLKKVDRSQIRDRSGAAVGSGGGDTGPHGSGLPPAGVAPSGANGSMADALAAALQKRKEKVSKSDDEDDDDDW